MSLSGNTCHRFFLRNERWGQRKATITFEDTKLRALKTLDMLIEHGIQHVRTHVDVTDPSLTAMRAMLEVKEEIKDKVNVHMSHFPKKVLNHLRMVEL